jgi:hypothetical protein
MISKYKNNFLKGIYATKKLSSHKTLHAPHREDLILKRPLRRGLCLLYNHPLWESQCSNWLLSCKLQHVTFNLGFISNLLVSTWYHHKLLLSQWFCNPLLVGWKTNNHSLCGWKEGILILKTRPRLFTITGGFSNSEIIWELELVILCRFK